MCCLESCLGREVCTSYVYQYIYIFVYMSVSIWGGEVVPPLMYLIGVTLAYGPHALPQAEGAVINFKIQCVAV